MRNDDATLKNNVSSEYNYSNRDGRRSNREWIFDQAAIREMKRTTIQRFKIISSCSLWKFSQWEKRKYNEQRLKSFNVVHSFLNNRQERKKKDTVEFQAENNKLIIGSRGIDRISRWAPPCELKNSRRVSVNGTKTPRGGRWWLLYGRTRDERRS